MLVVLDATVLLADPLCTSDAWGVLAHAADAWDLKIMVPSVVLVEAIAGYQRMIAEAKIATEGFMKKKRFGNLGLSSAVDDMDMAFHEATESYADRLSKKLSDLNASIVPLPDVPHSVLIERAVSRTKPCSATGGGYRDTLNWLTVIELLGEYSDDVYWVSSNTKDFGDDFAPESDPDSSSTPVELHKELRDELAAAGFVGRVKYAKELRDLVSDLAATLAPDLPQDMRDLRSQLRTQKLTQFVAQEVLPGVAPSVLEPRRCALPVDTIAAELLAVGELTDFEIEIRGSLGGDEALIDFKITGESVVVLTLPVDHQIGADATLSPDGQTAQVQISKPLAFRGYLTTDSVGKPLSGEVTKITSLADDRLRDAWREKDARDRARVALDTGVLANALAKNFRPTIDPALIAAMTPQFSANFAAMIESLNSRMTIDPKVLEKLRSSAMIDPKVLEKLRSSAMIDPKVLEKLRSSMTIDPKMLESLRLASSAWVKAVDEAVAQDEPGGTTEDESGSEPLATTPDDVQPEQTADGEPPSEDSDRAT